MKKSVASVAFAKKWLQMAQLSHCFATLGENQKCSECLKHPFFSVFFAKQKAAKPRCYNLYDHLFFLYFSLHLNCSEIFTRNGHTKHVIII